MVAPNPELDAEAARVAEWLKSLVAYTYTYEGTAQLHDGGDMASFLVEDDESLNRVLRGLAWANDPNQPDTVRVRIRVDFFEEQ